MAGPGYTTAAAVGSEHARAVWALAAREHFLDTARTYHAYVTYADLADFVQQRSLIRTGQLLHHWIGDVLYRVAQECVERREPLLSSLCVDATGSVGQTYADTVLTLTHEQVGDPDEHAAQERLDCYRRFGATLPAGGGEPALPPPLLARRQRAAAPPAGRTAATATRSGTARPRASRATPPPAPVEKPLAICPVHFTVLPVSGVCDLCD